eukprot:4140305-Prymnesium_polylepis.4
MSAMRSANVLRSGAQSDDCAALTTALDSATATVASGSSRSWLPTALWLPTMCWRHVPHVRLQCCDMRSSDKPDGCHALPKTLPNDRLHRRRSVASWFSRALSLREHEITGAGQPSSRQGHGPASAQSMDHTSGHSKAESMNGARK